jgi:glucose-6-phosphate 1-dehydrogenase
MSENESASQLPPTIFVLFGTGDLARRMVLPAFFGLAQRGLLLAEWRFGVGRGDVLDEDFPARVQVEDLLPPAPAMACWR